MKHLFARLAALLGCSVFVSQPGLAWDYEGHRVVNQLALAALPKDFPAFAMTAAARERIAFLSGEAGFIPVVERTNIARGLSEGSGVRSFVALASSWSSRQNSNRCPGDTKVGILLDGDSGP